MIFEDKRLDGSIWMDPNGQTLKSNRNWMFIFSATLDKILQIWNLQASSNSCSIMKNVSILLFFPVVESERWFYGSRWLPEEIEIEARVAGPKGKLALAVVEVRRKANAKLIAIAQQWMASISLNPSKASKLWNLNRSATQNLLGKILLDFQQLNLPGFSPIWSHFHSKKEISHLGRKLLFENYFRSVISPTFNVRGMHELVGS